MSAVPNVDTAMMAANRLAPNGTTVLTASAAMLCEAAMSEIGSKNRKLRLVSRYTNVTTAAPSTIARGTVRCGSRASPERYEACCQPPYDQSTPTNARPKALANGTAWPSPPACVTITSGEPRASPMTITTPIPNNFNPVKKLVKRSATFTRNKFMPVMATTVATASTSCPVWLRGKRNDR